MRARNKQQKVALRAGAVLAFTGAMVMAGAAMSVQAANSTCNGVFPGQTPHVIQKVASSSSVEIGHDVTFTLTWTPKGKGGSANVRDCFRVDDGKDKSLNALVAGLDATKNVSPNTGTTTFTVTVPDDPALAGHALVDRAKCEQACEESKSNIVSVTITGHPVEPTPTITPTETPTLTPTETPTGSPTETPTGSPSATVLGKRITRGSRGALAKTGTATNTLFLLYGGMLALFGIGLLLMSAEPEPNRRRS
ncbi:MAG: hypothetical protein ABR552_07830 [Actinomycetota bacterium]